LFISFLGSSAEIATNSKRIEWQFSNSAGRLSRAVPLYLAEQVKFSSGACAQILAPWMAQEAAGFALISHPWPDDAAIGYSLAAKQKCDYVITTHLKAQGEPWILELRVLRSHDS